MGEAEVRGADGSMASKLAVCGHCVGVWELAMPCRMA